MATVQASVPTWSGLSSHAAVSTGFVTSSRANVRVTAASRIAARQTQSIRSEYREDNTNRPAPPSSPPGLSGTEVPLAGQTTSSPLKQKGIPFDQRIAYICQDCGYIYAEETPWEEVDDATYSCPKCSAPKDRFVASNVSLGEEPYDVTKDGPASPN